MSQQLEDADLVLEILGLAGSFYRPDHQQSARRSHHGEA
jgi:hypothetical protein